MLGDRIDNIYINHRHIDYHDASISRCVPPLLLTTLSKTRSNDTSRLITTNNTWVFSAEFSCRGSSASCRTLHLVSAELHRDGFSCRRHIATDRSMEHGRLPLQASGESRLNTDRDSRRSSIASATHAHYSFFTRRCRFRRVTLHLQTIGKMNSRGLLGNNLDSFTTRK